MNNRVVVTGIGPVTATGIGKNQFLSSLASQSTNIADIPEESLRMHRFRSRKYVPSPVFDLKDHGLSSPYSSIMQHESKMAVLGAKLAFEDAGIGIVQISRNQFAPDGASECSVVVGMGMGGLDAAFRSYLAHVHEDQCDLVMPAVRDARYKRMVIPMTMPNSVAAWISILFGLHGESYTINASCASGTVAVGEAFRKIRSGQTRIVLAGGVESLNDSTGAIMRGFDILGVLTKAPNGLPEPFSDKRTGFLFSEGACCMLVLEELEHARARDARVYAEVVDYAANSDAHNIVQVDPSGRRIQELLSRLANGRKIDYLNSHGTGTIENDRTEANAILSVFGNRETQPAIAATKGILGHTLGASGAIEAAVTAMAVLDSVVFGTPSMDPIENLKVITETREMPIQKAISTSYGFGGHNAGLLMKKVHDDE